MVTSSRTSTVRFTCGMPICKDLNIADLLEVQLPGCVGCLPYSSLAKSAANADPMIDDILSFGEKVCQLKANLVYRDHMKASPNSNKYSKNVSASSSKVSLIKSGQSPNNDKVSPNSDSTKSQDKNVQGSSRPQVNLTTDSTGSQVKNHTSSCSSQVKDGTNFSKDQISPSINSSKGQVRDSTNSSKNQEGQMSHGSIKENFKITTTSHKDSSEDQVISGKSSSKTQEVITSNSSVKAHVKAQDIKNGSSSNKDPSVKAASRFHSDQPITDDSESNKELKNTYHKLPFISTDEQENKDNEDPRWKEQAQLNTNEERYRLARKLWKNPCVPDPNKNLTIFNSKQLKACQSLSSSNSRKRQRSQSYDMDDLQPLRKRQRRFENLAFTTNHIMRSKHQVMNEFLGNIQEPSISRQTAKKLENSHKEKQYMLDLALEELNAIQIFYNGLPDQDLTVTQEEVEMGWDATEHFEMIPNKSRSECGSCRKTGSMESIMKVYLR
ncbi:hypothetical protein E2C01_006115 [Portunus trituberculatus]|uniref:Uncharacterized protein n=1 Tax=Portunus trituberculatus TaxID=210409 RepID=A0A5B7D0X8_PORTR|nr:hypothetical protein [Portunus trituberculatus]